MSENPESLVESTINFIEAFERTAGEPLKALQLPALAFNKLLDEINLRENRPERTSDVIQLMATTITRIKPPMEGELRIVSTDNFGGDYPNEYFVAEGIPSQNMAECMCEAINEKFSGDGAPRWHKVVDAAYRLAPGFEP
jgi:hypothetical protein